jgi:hypothetical protein
VLCDLYTAQAVVSTAVAGMCWPDAESISKAVSVCKWVASALACTPTHIEATCSQLISPALTRDVLHALLRRDCNTALWHFRPLCDS